MPDHAATLENSSPLAKNHRFSSFVPFLAYAGIVALCFSPVLYRLLTYSFKEELYSHIPLIPFIAGYLIWITRAALPSPGKEGRARGVGVLICAFLMLAAAFFLQQRGPLSRNDSLVAPVFAFYLFLVTGALFFLGRRFCGKIAFPLAFMVFVVPFPEAVSNALEIASQHASAEIYAWMMNLVGATYYREGLRFSLPGIDIRVAQECSGIRSSFVLFLTSLLAGYMFLRSTWKKALLAAFVIPLGVIRNGFRVLVLSLLTVHVSPDIIDSPLHHRGGPIFFALSLIPFLALLLWLRRSERHSSSDKISSSKTAFSSSGSNP